jgi:hypothetical protein
MNDEMLNEINNVIKNTHLSKIVLEYVEHELEYELELREKTLDLCLDSDGYISYDNYSINITSGFRLKDSKFRYFYSKIRDEWNVKQI